MSFLKDKERGLRGESLFECGLQRQGVEYVNVSEDEEYQDIDVDFIADGMKYEIKTDYRYNDTGNLAVENKVYYYDGHSRRGGLHTTSADYIVYVIPPQINEDNHLKGTLIFVSLGNLKHIINNYDNRTALCKESYKETEIILVRPDRYSDVFYSIEVGEF